METSAQNIYNRFLTEEFGDSIYKISIKIVQTNPLTMPNEKRFTRNTLNPLFEAS